MKLFRFRNLLILGVLIGIAVVVAKALGGNKDEIDYSTPSYTPTYTPPEPALAPEPEASGDTSGNGDAAGTEDSTDDEPATSESRTD